MLCKKYEIYNISVLENEIQMQQKLKWSKSQQHMKIKSNLTIKDYNINKNNQGHMHQFKKSNLTVKECIRRKYL